MTQIALREVDAEWRCTNAGDCCTRPSHVYMTEIEKRVLELAASVARPEAVLSWIPAHEPGFVALVAHPCPLHEIGVDGHGRCTVYSSRPYNCRRFACMRPDPKSEPWVEDETGCRNLLDRLTTSRVARRMITLIQRRAQKWALKNGWSAQSR